MRLVSFVPALFPLCAVVSGCDLIKFQGVVRTERVTADGKVIRTEEKVDRIEDFPAALGRAADVMGEATAEMIAVLVDVPPPGEVKLSDLAPELAELEQNPRLNLLKGAKKDDGTPHDFRYVRLGVPSYDGFFKTAAELHATLVLTQKTVARMRELSLSVIQKGDQTDAVELVKLVSTATQVAKATGRSAEATELEELAQSAKLLAALTKNLAMKTQQLVVTGQQLVAGAPASITNLKVVIHLDLVVKGLEASVDMIGQSAGTLGELAGELTAFVA